MSPELKELKEYLQTELANATEHYQLHKGKVKDKETSDLYDGIMEGIRSSLNAAISKIDEISARSESVPFVSKGEWIEQGSSGFAGFRCIKCLTWKYANEEKRCDCD